MKNLFARLALASSLASFLASAQPVLAQGTAFTYQGRLNTNAVPANGFYDFQFSLYPNSAGTGSPLGTGTITQPAIGVTNGLFITTLNFGSVFTGNATWLAMSVRSNGVGSYTAMTPLQELNPTPYAMFANTAGNVLGGGSVSAGTITLTGSLDLPATSPTAGIIYSGGSTLLDSYGLYNFFAGLNAGNLTLTGTEDTGLGYGALQSDTSGFGNTATGAFALTANTSGYDNTATGANALVNNTMGIFNVAVGNSALQDNSSGSENTAVGIFALYNNTNGADNTASGVEALYANTTGTGNVALGYQAGYNILGSFNIDIGSEGNSSDNGVIRLGTPGTQTKTIIAGTAVGINTNTPSQALEVNGNYVQIDGANANNGAGPIDAYIGGNGSGSDVQVGSFNSNIANVAFYNWGNGTYMHIFCSVISIEGGSDLAEPFEVTSPNRDIPEGSVVVIDDENAGRLKVSSQPYDTRVAGVLSGANGINPGIQMQQQGLLAGAKNVALTGRVYVLADAAYGAIKPGDLLTTSATPGHAMKVKNHAKAQGAILGKAMSGLKEGQGTVLVLVTLQ